MDLIEDCMAEVVFPGKDQTNGVILTADSPRLNMRSEQEEEMCCNSSQISHSASPSPCSSPNEESLGIEEKGDESDAVTTVTSPENINAHSNPGKNVKLPGNIKDSFSEDDDVDDEDRLVIDDEFLGKAAARNGNIQNRAYTCLQCTMTTTSVKSYLRHLNEDHSIEFSIYECDLCEYATVYKQMLPRHRKLHYLAEQVDNPSTIVHSTGKTPEICVSKNKAFVNMSFQISSQQNSSFIMEEANDMEEEDGSDSPPRDEIPSSAPLTITAENIDQALDEDKKRKKKTRQEVDPGKYFEAVDSSGTKYACSHCGNIYKWRKSLNKHWKEKHNMDPLVEVASPPGMLELLKSGKYTQLGARRIYDKIFLTTIKASKSDDSSCAAPSSRNLTHSSNPSKLVNKSKPLPATSSLTSPDIPLIPKMIGPFISSTAQPVFPGMPVSLPHISLHSNDYDSPEEGVLDLSRDSKPSTRNCPYSAMTTAGQDHNISLYQEQPIDFSKNRNSIETVSAEKVWKDMKSITSAYNINYITSKLHQCSKCEFASNSEVELANHMSSHLNKRIINCYECKIQMNSMDELNNHFIKLHFQKLSEYKEAIKKVPHGLQQAYHILNLELSDAELGSQDLGASEGKSLKCKKCDFEAKWPAELQKHAVSHSEERPYICMVCGSTYKWKWDLVKHFQKSHPYLPNPYRKNDKKDTADESSEDEDEPETKRPKFEAADERINGDRYSRDDTISVEGIIAATQAGQTFITSQPNILDEPTMERNLALLNTFPYATNGESAHGAQIIQTTQETQERFDEAQEAVQDTVKIQYNSDSGSNGSHSGKRNGGRDNVSSSSGPVGTRPEELPYKCTMCNYHARWPSEVTQHMKNHSDSKPYLCPRCEYRSKWKWDVVKHLKRCGGGGINDVIDTTKAMRKDVAVSSRPPNAIITQQGEVHQMTPQPSLPYILPLVNENVQKRIIMMSQSSAPSDDNIIKPEFSASTRNLNNGNIYNNNNMENTIKNNYTAYMNGLPFARLNPHTPTVNNTFSTRGKVDPSSRPAYSPVPTPATYSSSSRQSSGEVWNCLHCPFTTQSQAELKRHSGLHSDDKPFKCDACHYSSRWACDLKKHRKSYNHFPKADISKEMREKIEKPPHRFKCCQCAIYFETLQGLLEHRLAEHVGQGISQSSPASLTENEIDLARIKHPRKPMKQIQCPKCTFICKNRQTMEGHMNEHELLELGGIHCFYCSSIFKDKESLLDHISTHSAFNPKEWETFFMISEDEQNQPEVEKVVNQSVDNVKDQHPDSNKTEINHKTNHFQLKDAEKNAADSTEARIQHILNEISRQMFSSQTTTYPNVFKCEWCTAEFVNLTAVYKHASQAHPIQLKEQDVSTSMSDHASLQKLSSGEKIPVKKPYSGEPIDILRQQVAEKRNHQLVEKYFERSSPRIHENLSQKKDDEESAKLYSCDKCSFSSSNSTAFHCHYEHHGSKQTAHCWFCDYSVDQVGHLYQHMKISHTCKWKILSQDPRYEAHIKRINLAMAVAGTLDNNSDSLCGVVDHSSKNKTTPSEMTHEIIYITKQQYIWSGIPVNIVPVSNALNFVCPHCPFCDASIAETCCHVVQSHRAMSKFTCKMCQFSDDNIHVMSDHCKKEHPLTERIVEVLDFKQINFSELQIVQLNALRKQMTLDLKSKSESDPDIRSLAIKVMSCPFCPFKTKVAEQMKVHISNHSRQARYQCQMCDFSSDSTAVISNHVKVHDTVYTLDSRSLNKTKGQIKVKKESMERKMGEPESKMIARVQPIMGTVEPDHNDQEESVKLKMSKRMRYRCSACPYHTTCRSNMVKHMRQHNNSKKYKCYKCSYGAARAVLLKNHLDSHETLTEDEGQHYDIFCDPNNPVNDFVNADGESEETEFDDDDNIDFDDLDEKAIADLEAKDILEVEASHKALILLDNGDSFEKQFHKQKCPHCPFSSNSGNEIHKHLHFHGTQEKYKCDRCSYSLDRLNLLSQHRKLHADEPGYITNPPTADLLNTSFILQQNAEVAESKDRDESADLSVGNDESSGSQFCAHCPYEATKKKLFDIHCNSHGLRKRYICDLCDWSADHMGLIYQHRRVHEHEPAYSITPEDKIFLNQEFDDGAEGEFEAKFMEIKNIDQPVKDGQTEIRLSPPFKLTVIKKSYPCKLCPYKSCSRDSYSVHKSMHSSDSQFACTDCSYAAVTRGILQQHLQLHVAASTEVSSPTSSAMKSLTNTHQSSDLETPSLHHESGPMFSNKKESQPQNQLKQDPTSQELKCKHCPFTASSQNALADHIKGHISQESLICPYCDFTATSRQIMFPHIQIHFPGTRLEQEALDDMVEEHTSMNNNISHNNNHNSHYDTSKTLSLKPEKTSSVVEKEAVKTKRIYVCQFCEREFEAKQLMIDHEKQHLIGSQTTHDTS